MSGIVWMLLTNRRSGNVEGLTEEALGLRIPALRLNYACKVVEAGGVVRVPFANRISSNLESLTVEALGLRRSTLRLAHTCEVIEASGIVWMPSPIKARKISRASVRTASAAANLPILTNTSACRSRARGRFRGGAASRTRATKLVA